MQSSPTSPATLLSPSTLVISEPPLCVDLGFLLLSSCSTLFAHDMFKQSSLQCHLCLHPLFSSFSFWHMYLLSLYFFCLLFILCCTTKLSLFSISAIMQALLELLVCQFSCWTDIYTFHHSGTTAGVRRPEHHQSALMSAGAGIVFEA